MNPSNQSADDILKRIAYFESSSWRNPTLATDNIVNDSKTQLYNLIKAELPKKKDEHPVDSQTGEPVETYGYEAEFNSALKQVDQALRKVLGVSDE